MQKKIIGLLSLFLVPAITSAAQGFDPTGGAFGDLLANILVFINNVLIPFIIGIGFLAFVWGMFRFFILGGADEEKKEQGKSLMIWATIGFVLIIIFFGVVNLLTESTGLSGDTIRDIPRINIP
jgi:uncharacterized membrane protein YidH (DUF202 family)